MDETTERRRRLLRALATVRDVPHAPIDRHVEIRAGRDSNGQAAAQPRRPLQKSKYQENHSFHKHFHDLWVADEDRGPGRPRPQNQ